MPEKTLAFAGDPCHGGKHSKERVTVLIGSNMSGTEKLPMLVIGKSKAPRCFKGVKSLPVLYEANKKAWVTQQIFESYVRRLDRKFDLEGRKILLFVDNCAAHGHINNLKSVRVEFLPPKHDKCPTTDGPQGVIRTLKVNYRSCLLSRVVVCLDSGKVYSVDLLGALSMLADAWKSIPSTTLHNCFRHAGFVLNGESAALDEDSVVEQVSGSEQLIDDLRTAGVEIPSNVSFSEFARVDSELELCAGLTDEEIIRQVLAESESDDDDDLPATAQPTQAELMQAVATLSSAYGDSTTLAEIQADLLTQKRSMVQKRINHFFHPLAQ